MLAQYMTNILAQEALDALVKLLDAINILLNHPPSTVGKVRLARLKRLDLLLDLKVPRDVRYEVLDQRKRPHGLNGNWDILRQLA